MERMFMLMYMMSQPGRITEITAIRHQDTMNGGVRNILAHNGMMCMVLPFWQQVQGIIKDVVIRSPFMWPDEVVRKAEDSVVEEREARRAASERQENNSGRPNEDDHNDHDDHGGGSNSGRNDTIEDPDNDVGF
ncbi:hypothetical protein FOVG_17155 [Fusarium oxysporum f. sp. pisi HDV247]|uniref:Uncharacterized protein n=1 Tax=Fusarium oxysporum f. sp. pisi HDV247 TaxID=1080344 RepID=W9NFJ0_FUSOX|nr:hypothetical protein FOVG_17155 [Fusarium oxysporum f. sp. pisi HDV247]